MKFQLLFFSHSLSIPPTLKTSGLVAAAGWRWAGRSSCRRGLFAARLTPTLPEANSGPHGCLSYPAPFPPSPSPHQIPGQTSLISRSTLIQHSFELATNNCCTTHGLAVHWYRASFLPPFSSCPNILVVLVWLVKTVCGSCRFIQPVNICECTDLIKSASLVFHFTIQLSLSGM